MQDGKSITLKSGPCGYMLTAVIILSRALQSGGVPMEEWSVLSWLLMAVPAAWPVLLFVGASVFRLACDLVSTIFGGR
jgi:hypothetical protein